MLRSPKSEVASSVHFADLGTLFLGFEVEDLKVGVT